MSQNLLQSVSNALRLLELFNGPVKELSLTEISHKLSIGKSTTHRLLSTLEHHEFMEQNQDNGRYRLSLKVVSLAANKLGTLNVIKECHGTLKDLSIATGESTHLSFYGNGQITFVDKIMGNKPSIMSSTIGYRMPAYITASGKMFLAYLPEDKLDLFLQTTELKAYTPYTITEKDVLLQQLREFKASGYSEDQQESDEGLVCFAAPILGSSGEILATMSLSGAVSRMNAKRDKMIEEVIKAAAKGSALCAWQIWDR